MGINFCGLQRRVRPNGSPEMEKDGATSPSLMRPGCLWHAMKVRKGPEAKPETKLVITLEYLIASSPGLNVNMMSSGGETPMHNKQSSRKIHPSFDGDVEQVVLSKPKKKVCFRSPVVADVFVLRRSPEMEMEMDM